MKHYVYNSDKFNCLTVKNTDKGLLITGETKEGLKISDEIQNPHDSRQFLPIKEIIERRDSRDYPLGNNYYFKVLL